MTGNKSYYNTLQSYEDEHAHKTFVLEQCKESSILLEAFTIIEKYHDQPRYFWRGKYYTHPTRVARILLEELEVTSLDAILIALCHDLGEWTNFPIKEIRSLFGDSVYHGVQLLTWNKKEDTWATFVSKIVESKTPFLIKIKLADKLDNNRGIIFSDNLKEKEKAMTKTIDIIQPIALKYHPKLWTLFETSLQNIQASMETRPLK